MKRIYFFFACLGMAAWLLTACDPNEPEVIIPDSFPKKHLIEEFTGQKCGYCPYGMDCIHDFIGNDTNWVLVLHHYGYSPDNFSVNGSKTITNALGVDGAPSVTINRAKTKYSTRSATVFHPADLETTSKAQFNETTYASINIANTYDEASRELNIHISGLIALEETPDLYLTVLVKESGMIDTQSDYYNTFEGWQEFRHTNAVRAFLTNAKGDEIVVVNQRYSADYTLTLKDTWNPDNCMVVAFLTESFKPVVQAEQRPVKKGTQGGVDIQHGGITPVPVPDYYPEVNATDGPGTYTSNKSETLPTGSLYYQKYPDYGLTYWCVQAYNEDASITINKTTCVPFTFIYFLTDIDQSLSAVPYGTYDLKNTNEPGTAVAGYRDDSTQSIGGSRFYFTSLSYLKQGYLVPEAQWLIADGKLTISEEGWSVVGHTRNGADIVLVGTQPLEIKGQMNAPQRIKQNREPETL